MPLVSPKTLEAALASYVFEPTAQQLAAASRWAKLIRDGLINNVKETALEADFRRFIIEEVLGYRSVSAGPDYSVATKEPIGSGEVDLALGAFSATERKVLAPFELKGPSLKNLDAIMPGRAKSPVQQAWEYAIDAPGSHWVLVSNQTEIRLYAMGRGRRDFETFDLSKLDDVAHLRRFHLLLAEENLLGGMTASLLERSLQEDKEITAALYNDYKSLRTTLLDVVRAQHTTDAPDEVIRLAQKLLDRVLFIAFAEDTVLLPDNQLKRAVSFSDPYDPKPKWTYLKSLFAAVDKGNPRLDIPPYNGGLFAPDDTLDGLSIPDDVCVKLAGLGDYDFKSQVSVTILGHIFEQSITDIERLLAEALGEEPPTTPKRKREGVVYTPDFVTRFIVEKTIGTHLEEARERLIPMYSTAVDDDGVIKWQGKTSERDFWRAYLETIKALKIVDPACGSGAFLIAAFDYLKAEQERVRSRLLELEPGLLVFASDSIDVEIITQNLYGVDVNAESVEITKLSLWLKTAKRGRQLESLDRTIQMGNSIIEDADFHRRAFVWRDAFPEIFEAGGFDIAIGNPPYVRMEHLAPIKPYLERRYEVVADRADLYAYFFELGVRVLKPGGRLGYISSSSFFRTNSGEPLRKYLANSAEVETVVDFDDLQVFEGVTTYPAILTLRRNNGQSPSSGVMFLNQRDALPDDLGREFEARARLMPRTRLNSTAWRFEADSLDALRKKIASGRKTLAEVFGAPMYGIKTGLNDAFVVDRSTRDGLIDQDARSAEVLKPFLVGENLKRWSIDPSDDWLIYTPKNRIDIEEYPAIRDHLLPFKERLERRATKQAWFELQQAQQSCEPWFQQPKLVYPEMSQGPKFSVDTLPHYVSNKVFYLATDDSGLVAYLGSKPLWFIMFGETSPLRGGQWRLELREHRMSALPVFEAGELSPLAELGKEIQTRCDERRARAAAFVVRSGDLSADGAPVVAANWAEQDFGAFRKSVRKATKSDIPVSERDEWEQHFNAVREQIVSLNSRIADLEAHINDRVGNMLGLSQEELALIDEALRGQY
jgi:hypothetical protein